MNLKVCLFILLFLFASNILDAQMKNLSKQEFQAEIVDQWWSSENKDAKRDCDMRIFVIKGSEFELNCVNWTDGFSGNKCNYDLTLTDNFFELKPKTCQNAINPGFLYGYLSENNQLLLLISKKQLALSAGLMSEKNWLTFEKIKR